MDRQDNMVDLAPMLNPSYTDMSYFLTKSSPNGASFRFHGYKGSYCVDQIMVDIENAALRTGTTLKARRRMRGTKHRKTSIEFNLIKHFLSPSSNQEYHENCIQQNGKIIQPTHSIKGFCKPLVTEYNGTMIKKNKSAF